MPAQAFLSSFDAGWVEHANQRSLAEKCRVETPRIRNGRQHPGRLDVAEVHAADDDFRGNEHDDDPLEHVAFLVVHDFEEELGVVLDEVQLVLEVVEATLHFELLAEALPHVDVLRHFPRDVTPLQSLSRERE